MDALPGTGRGTAESGDLKLDLSFGLSPAGRTWLSRQFACYPCHLTRPFHLDRKPGGLATLFVQSVSGGLYDREEVNGRIRVGSGAQAHVTTQASTIVHRGSDIRQSMTLEVAAGGFLAYTPDATILFDGAGFAQRTRVRCQSGGHVVLVDSVMAHDPYGRGSGLRYWRSEIDIRDAAGHVYMDRQHLEARDLVSALGPEERFRGMASVFLIGPCYGDETVANLRRVLSPLAGVYAGVGRLPDAGGVIVRGLAESGSALSAIHDAGFVVGFASVFGCAPAPRRK